MKLRTLSALVALFLIQTTLQAKVVTQHQQAVPNINNQKLALITINNQFVSVEKPTNRLIVGPTSIGPAEIFYAIFNDNGDVFFRSALTNKYVSTSGRSNGQLTATGLRQDRSAAFHIQFLNENKEKLLFKSAQNGKYLTGKLHQGKYYLYASQDKPRNFNAVRYVLIHEVAIKSKTLKTYLSLQTKKDSELKTQNTLKFSASKVGPNQRFQAIQVDQDRLYLRSTKNGRYVRMFQKGQHYYLLVTANAMGLNSFSVDETPAGIQFKAANGLFLNAAGGHVAQLAPIGDMFEMEKLD